MAVEHPDRVTRAAILDIVPLPYSTVTREFATQYFHWFFLIQPAPFPETLIGNNAEFYLRSRFLRPTGGTGAVTDEAFAEYLRCFKDPATIHATCEDYRAGATIDLEHSGADGAKKVTCPLLILWGERGTVGRLYDPMKIWREHATNVTGKALPAGHFLPEEVPDETLVRADDVPHVMYPRGTNPMTPTGHVQPWEALPPFRSPCSIQSEGTETCIGIGASELTRVGAIGLSIVGARFWRSQSG